MSYYEDNRATVAKRARAWEKKNPEKHQRIYRSATMKWRHGITDAEKAKIIFEQGGCPICLTTEAKWDIDHDHKCCPKGRSCVKCRRGVLCSQCNSAIGLFKESLDNLKRAVEYMSR